MNHREELEKKIEQSPIVFSEVRVFDADLNRVWSTLTDTDHLGKLLGIDPADVEEIPIRLGVSKRKIYWKSMDQHFTEEPYVWEYGKWFGNLRKEGEGPLDEFTQLVEFHQEANGVRAELKFGYKPHKSIPGLVFRFLSVKLRRDLKKLIAAIDFKREAPLPAHQSFPVNKNRLVDMGKALKAAGLDSKLCRKFQYHIEESVDTDLKNIEPFELAKRWAQNDDALSEYREKLLQICIEGVRAGFLKMNWSLICPGCRGPKSMVEELKDLKFQSHCETCNISFGARFSESVQVSFRPVPSLRKLEEKLACQAGPRRTPHQLHAQYINPEETLSLDTDVFNQKGRLILRVEDGDKKIELHESGDYRIGLEEITMVPQEVFRIQNSLDHRVRFVIQQQTLPNWTLTAAELIRRQSFVDYFSDQILSPDLQAEVGTITLMFSDLVGSTKLYREKGDAGAFDEVVAHFHILKEILNRHGGTLVKTVGDAIMAVFEEPENAVKCGIEIQEAMKSGSELGLRLGIHVGPCLAVTLNDRLDYFGATVNQAARMEGQCIPGQLVLSQDLHKDPEVQNLIAIDELEIAEDQVQVKGIEIPLNIFRVLC